MFNSKEAFYSELFNKGLTNECREYLNSLNSSELVELIVELDYQLWKKCKEVAWYDEHKARFEYESAYNCISEIIKGDDSND